MTNATDRAVETDWAQQAADAICDSHGWPPNGPLYVNIRKEIAAALRKERESTVERCAVVACERLAHSLRYQADWPKHRVAETEMLAAIRALNIPKGD